MDSNAQTLTAAFSFGILLQAATAAAFLYIKGHGSTIFKDGPRLVLVLFLLFAALWAQIEFANLMLSTTSSSTCQGTLIASTAFDQLARVAMEQFLLWAIGRGTSQSLERMLLQGLVFIRVVAGGIHVGFSRPEFAPTCTPQSSLLPASIVVLVLDVVIVILLLIRFGALGMFQDLGEKTSCKGLILTVAGFIVWTGSSVARILGLSGTTLPLRTVLPSAGLLVLIGIVSLFSASLLAVKREEETTPEARSPFVGGTGSTREIFRGDYGNGSPKDGNLFSRNGNLFVVNQTPRESSYLQTNRGSDTKGFQRLEDSVTETRDNEQTQESTKRGPGYRGSSGVFGNIVNAPMIGNNQGGAASQIQPSANVIRARDALPALPGSEIASPSQSRSIFNWGRPKVHAKAPIRSLGISNPIMTDTQDSEQRPFAKILTVDLATAAINEKERRRLAAERTRVMYDRPVPPRPAFNSHDGLKQNASIIKKEMPQLPKEELSTIEGSVTSSLLVADSHANSTGASLSPGQEEVRRRSPRNLEAFNFSLGERALPQSGVQRKPTIGLPSNPRSQRVLAKQSKAPSEQVMLMNNIVYENPGMVRTIIQDATETVESSKRLKHADQSSPVASFTTTLVHTESIIHRPRPYRKDSEKDRALFPSEPSPSTHTRSKSGSKAIFSTAVTANAIHSRSKSSSAVSAHKSLFGTPIGSPTNLPPLPPMPKTASELRRLLPNNTKSMTVDEKIELLFPAPPQSNPAHKRRSSVPTLPKLPSVYLADSQLGRSPTEEAPQSRRTSKRTTIASFSMTTDQKAEIDTLKQIKNKDVTHNITSLSPNEFEMPTLFSEAEPVVDTMKLDRDTVNPIAESKELLDTDPRKSTATDTTADDSTTYWGSVHSKVPQIDMKKAWQTARSTLVKGKLSNLPVEGSKSRPSTSRLSESVPLVLDAGQSRFSISSIGDSHRRSFLLDDDEELPGSISLANNMPSWHHRIGEQPPTFSERDSKTRTRKMPPPTPLLLNKPGKNAKIVIHATEPSPVESPQKAIEDIKAQLDRLEKPVDDAFGSILRDADGIQIQIQDRLRLLESLEKEMGQQEDQWQQMHTTIDRNSTSTTYTDRSPLPQLARSAEITGIASKRQSKRQSRTSLYRSRGSLSQSSSSEDLKSAASTQKLQNKRASWQQRLAEAQMEYQENAPSLLGNSLNFFTVSKAQLGSPTPPDSVNSESDFDSGSDGESVDFVLSEPPKKAAMLWKAPVLSPKTATGRLWSHPYKTSPSCVEALEPAAKHLRPSQRVIVESLAITSSKLWTKPSPTDTRTSAFGLWRCRASRPPSIVIKRASQKPERKTRRVTYLPDIVESPLPLPSKDDTDQLGIFRFPWGETSDQPIYQPPFNPNYLATATINSNLVMRSHDLEPDSDYTKSFFDDYDEEESGDEEANFESEDSDDEFDDFDESTLDDIADLLGSDNVPSRQSMFSARDIIDDYEVEADFESNLRDSSSTVMAKLPPMQLPILPLAMSATKISSPVHVISMASPEPTVPEKSTLLSVAKALLWTPPTAPTAREDVSQSGLFSVRDRLPVTRGTEVTPAAVGMLKVAKSSSARLPEISSKDLWSLEQATSAEINWLFVPAVKSSTRPKNASSLLWTAPVKRNTEPSRGLFDMSAPRSDYRTTSSQPAAIVMSRKTSLPKSTLTQLESNELWNGARPQSIEQDWISESSVRPASPSLYSPTSSGRSSPISVYSDAASVTTVDTKASSIWSSIGNAVPTWWEARSKKSPKISPQEIKLNPTIPKLRRQKSREALATVRESRVLASRDMWEAMAESSTNMPLKKSLQTKASNVSSKVMPSREHRHLVKSDADWDVALAEAIAAGSRIVEVARPTATKDEWVATARQAIFDSKPKMIRINATSKMWDDALTEAVIASQAVAATALPQLWSGSSKFETSPLKESLWVKQTIPRAVISSSDLPAAIQYRKALPAENPEFMILKSASLWKPTMATIADRDWLARKPVRKQTWTPRPALKSPKVDESIRMWSLATTATTSEEPADLFSHVKAKSIKKSKYSRIETLQRLKSTDLFTPATRTLETINWLDSTSSFVTSPVNETFSIVKRSLTWTHNNSAPVTVVEDNFKMWSVPARSISRLEPDLFAHMQPTVVKKPKSSRSEALQNLNTCELFAPAVQTTERTHWLHSTSILASAARTEKPLMLKRALTWSLQVVGPLTDNGSAMWSAPTTKPTTQPDLFAEIKGDHINKPKSSISQPLLQLNSDKLFAIAKRENIAVDWLHSTSISSSQQSLVEENTSSEQTQDTISRLDTSVNFPALQSPVTPDEPLEFGF